MAFFRRISILALAWMLAGSALYAQPPGRPSARPQEGDKQSETGEEVRQSQEKEEREAERRDARERAEREDRNERFDRRAPQRSRQPQQPKPQIGTTDAGRLASQQNIMLRLTPENLPDMQNIDVIEGSEFSTDLNLSNPNSKPVDAVRIIINYNPTYLNPMAINDSTIAEMIDGVPNAVVNRQLGQITYEAVLSTPIRELTRPLLFIRWQAVKPVFFSPIDFGQSRTDEYTELFYQGERVLGEAHEEGDGTLSMNVTVIPSDPAEALIMQEDPMLYVGSDERVGGVRLRIEEPEEPVRAGDVFTLDIVLDNRAHSRVDGVSMLLQYDSGKIEILDDDWDNWITLGTNILDGKYHTEFPFDYHMANAVYPIRGQIEYRVGTSVPDDFVGVVGTMARIKARALEPTSGTAIRFVFAPRAGLRTTEVTYLGEDVLGKTGIKNDGVEGVYFPILAARK